MGIEIVEQVAAGNGVDPVDLDTQLYDVIEVDALEARLNGTGGGQPRTTCCVEFTYRGYSVTVDEAGVITLDKQPSESGRADVSEAAADDRSRATTNC